MFYWHVQTLATKLISATRGSKWKSELYNTSQTKPWLADANASDLNAWRGIFKIACETNWRITPLCLRPRRTNVILLKAERAKLCGLVQHNLEWLYEHTTWEEEFGFAFQASLNTAIGSSTNLKVRDVCYCSISLILIKYLYLNEGTEQTWFNAFNFVQLSNTLLKQFREHNAS